MKLNKVRKLQVEYIQGLIDYCKEQKEFWQKIPMMALKCQGITGYSDQHQYAYSMGYWRIGLSDHGYAFRVDCATGDIYGWDKEKKPYKSPKSSMLVIKPEDLDAETIYMDLVTHSKKPISSYYEKTMTELAAEQYQEAMSWGVKEIYTR